MKIIVPTTIAIPIIGCIALIMGFLFMWNVEDKYTQEQIYAYEIKRNVNTSGDIPQAEDAQQNSYTSPGLIENLEGDEMPRNDSNTNTFNASEVSNINTTISNTNQIDTSDCPPTDSMNIYWANYKNEQYKFTVTYPASFSVVSSETTFTSFQEGRSAIPYPGIIYPDAGIFQNYSLGMPLGEWVNTYVQSWGTRKYLLEMTTIDELPAAHIFTPKSITGTPADEYFFIKDGEIFGLVGAHYQDENSCKNYILTKFFQSFHFTKETQS